VTYAVALPDRPLLDQLDDDPGPLRIGYTVRCALCEPHPEAVGAVEHAAQLLTELGHHGEEVDPPHDDRQLGRDFLAIWFVHQALEVERGAGLHDAIGVQQQPVAGPELFVPNGEPIRRRALDTKRCPGRVRESFDRPPAAEQ
jgi:Asp-tRNA(Asn)/Glu-tRNA(Gln) amidotransferase A subunit family amidase